MKTLRLFINSNLSEPINWTLIERDNITLTRTHDHNSVTSAPPLGKTMNAGVSDWSELPMFEDVQLDVYLSACCASIFKIDLAKVQNKKLTDELILGMVEEDLADNIEDVKPVVLNIIDENSYVAIFNHDFFDQLIAQLLQLNKPINFIQSIVYTTNFHPHSYTVCIEKNQRFIRISKYEYYILDDESPIPLALHNLLSSKPPKFITLYTDDTSLANKLMQQYKINVKIDNHYHYTDLTWNFYSQRSNQFNFRLNSNNKAILTDLYKYFRLFACVAIIFWIFNLIVIEIKSMKIRSEIKNELNVISPIQTINATNLSHIDDKINELRHQKGIYVDNDAIALFGTFLETVSSLNTSAITQINYENRKLQVFLNDSFNPAQFQSYKTILETKHIIANIESYKNFSNNLKKMGNNNNNNSGPSTIPTPDATTWVITLETSFNFNLTR